MSSAIIHSNLAQFGQIGWKAYKSIRKKAMEQEFSWSGLCISLSIAFFIVISCAYTLNFIDKSILNATQKLNNTKIYQLEKPQDLNITSSIIQKFPPNRLLPETSLALKKNSNFLLTSWFEAVPAYAAELDYQAKVINWNENLTINTDKTASLTVNYKNSGKSIWLKNNIFLETGPFLRSFSKVQHSSWMKYFRLAGLKNDVKAGESVSITFNILSPNGADQMIQENFQLVADGQPVKGSQIRLFIKTSNPAIVAQTPKANPKPTGSTTTNKTTSTAATPKTSAPAIPVNNTVIKNTSATSSTFCIALTEDQKKNYSECQTNAIETDPTNGISQNIQYPSEPILRIGIFNTTSAQRVKTDQICDVYAGNDILLSGLSANTLMTVSFDFTSKIYSVTTPGITVNSSKYIRLVPRMPLAIMTLLDRSVKSSSSTIYNDTQFRNIIEFRYSTSTKKFWIINELPIENYLKGLGETSNYSPAEFQKVLITAARTYAMYHYNRGIDFKVPDGSTKHADEHFHLDATYDQVYRGFSYEAKMPKLTQSVDDTKGAVVTYNGKIVITPFFSRSDGRTRSWEEVWGGTSKPWCKSVAVPQDTGQELWGHGVGMSARGALIMTRDEGKNWQDTLRYFYQGTQVTRVY